MKKNTTTAIASIATTSVQVGTREVVSVATARIEVSLRQQLEANKKDYETATKATKVAIKALETAVGAQGKELLAPARVPAESLVLLSAGALRVVEASNLKEVLDDDNVVSYYEVEATLGLESTSSSRFSRDSINVFSVASKASSAVMDAVKALDACKAVEDSLVETRNELSRKLASIPSLERQFMARMAESVLSSSEGGQAMLSQVDDAVKAMGFGDLPMLTAAK